jgi:hypothetical protein
VDEAIGAVPALDDLQPFVDFAAECLGRQLPAEEHGAHRLTELSQCAIRGMLLILAREASQDGFCLRGAES